MRKTSTIPSGHLSASRLARLAGLLSLVSLTAGISSEFGVVATLTSDPAAAAQNIMDAEALYRLGFIGNFVDYVCYAAATLLLYVLLKAQTPILALFGLAASLLATAVVASLAVQYLAPFIVAKAGTNTDAFDAAELQALSAVLLGVRGAGANVAMVFFGFHLLFVGLAIMRSRLAPWALGALSALGGACFIANSVVAFASPSTASHLIPYSLAPGILGQALLALWLLAIGVPNRVAP